jgi:hypothetical protein
VTCAAEGTGSGCPAAILMLALIGRFIAFEACYPTFGSLSSNSLTAASFCFS